MSYDLHWFRKTDSSFPLDDGRRSFYSSDQTGSPEEDVERRRLAEEIMALDDRFSMVAFEDGGFSSGCHLGSEEEDFVCAAIELGVGTASMALRGFHPDLLHNTLQVAEVLFRNGYLVFDPQLDNVYFDCETLNKAVRGERVSKAKTQKRSWWKWK